MRLTAAIGSATLGVAAILAATALAGGPVGGGSSIGLFYFVGQSPLTTTGGVVGRSSICSVPDTGAIGGGLDADLASQNGLSVQTTPIDAGDEGLVPDDGIAIEAQNFSGEEVRYGAFGACLVVPP